MSIPYENQVTLEEFYEMREKTEQVLEYIDGIVYMSPSPSTQHQRISGRLHAKLFSFLEEKNSECEVFHAPFDIELHNEQIEENKVVVPDLSVLCGKTGLNEQQFVGVPPLIIEIVSPSNQAHDLVVKLNLYMKYGVGEYWIINPMLHIVQLYRLDPESRQYNQLDVLKDKGKIKSEFLEGFSIDLEQLFKA
jgi:Uma2 family endonuclease